MALRNFLTLVLIVLLVAGFLLFWDLKPANLLNDRVNRALSSEVETPDAESYMIDIVSTKFSDNGDRVFILRASHSLYFKKSDRFDIVAPHFVAYDDNADAPWQLTAREGNVDGSGEKLVLKQDVNMWQELKKGQFNRLKTSRLTLYPKLKQVESKALVEISTPNGVTSGVGMDANLSKKVFSFHSRVKGVHFGL